MGIKEQLTRRVVQPAGLRYYQWRGDPLARLLGPRAKADPYPLYAEMRQAADASGLTRSPLGPVLASTHAAADRVLRDRRFGSSPALRPGYQRPAYEDGDPRAELIEFSLLELDPPDHTRIRRLVSGAFTPKAVAALEPWIRETVGRLLDQVSAKDGFDLIDALAFPLPMAVICRLLGVPAGDQAKFRAWGRHIAASADPATTRAAASQARAADLALTRYLRELVRTHRADPDESLLSALIAAEEEGDRLTADELVSTAMLLLIAGFETTVNLIGNGTVALLNARDQWDQLTADPALVPGAVEELLRYDSPAQLTGRTAAEDVELGDTLIKRGTPVFVALGGANRDPDVFDQPDQLRIGRPNAARHLAFSLGIHHCPGAVLARLEGRIAFEELTRRYPDLELAAAPVRRPQLILRGYESVPVRSAR